MFLVHIILQIDLAMFSGEILCQVQPNYLLYLPLCSAKFAILFWYFPIRQWATLHNLRWSYAIITFSSSLFLSAGILCDLVKIDLQPDAFLCSINDVKVSNTVDQRARNIITGAEVSSSSVVLIGLLQSFQKLSCFFSFLFFFLSLFLFCYFEYPISLYYFSGLPIVLCLPIWKTFKCFFRW